MDYESKLSLVKYFKNPKMFKHLKNEVELMTYNARTPPPPPTPSQKKRNEFKIKAYI